VLHNAGLTQCNTRLNHPTLFFGVN